MKLKATDFDGLFVIYPKILIDDRGYFEKLYSKKIFVENNLKADFVDINHSKTFRKGIFRGFHYQTEPMAEIKLIRCIKGKIEDYVIDMRKSSETFMKIFNITLSEINQNMLYIPSGFAHGFQTLEDETEVVYLSSNYYNASCEKVINCKDKLLNIEFQLEPILSDKDSNAPQIENNLKKYIV